MKANHHGRLLRRLRLEHGWTQNQLERQLGVVPKTVSKWETGATAN